MPVECCGKKRNSRFCPECGKRICTGPLMELLVNCRLTEKRLRTTAQKLREQAAGWEARGVSKNAGYCHEGAAENDKKADAWKARADALGALMEGKEVEESGES